MPAGAAREYGSRSASPDEPFLLDLSIGAGRSNDAAHGRRSPAISIALVAGGRRATLALPERRLAEIVAFGAERAAERCVALGMRVTYLVPGATVETLAPLVRRLARDHEIGLFGFDPARPGPDDPLRARARLLDLTGIRARWYARPFGAPVSPAAIEAAGVRLVPAAGTVGFGPLRIDATRALGLTDIFRRVPPADALAGPLVRTTIRVILGRALDPSTGRATRRAREGGVLHLPLVAGSFAGAVIDDLPRDLRPGSAPDLALLREVARAARAG